MRRLEPSEQNVARLAYKRILPAKRLGILSMPTRELDSRSQLTMSNLFPTEGASPNALRPVSRSLCGNRRRLSLLSGEAAQISWKPLLLASSAQAKTQAAPRSPRSSLRDPSRRRYRWHLTAKRLP